MYELVLSESKDDEEEYHHHRHGSCIHSLNNHKSSPSHFGGAYCNSTRSDLCLGIWVEHYIGFRKEMDDTTEVFDYGTPDQRWKLRTAFGA
mmetsp:Transcript_26110/g.38918  ORF Transcript_26110/g.38918 Transcript_26110/m.38918 type:complete len:91 (-) Transcript_26110:17-289(-)